MNAFDVGVQDRSLGCLLGLAVGDALGTTLEFSQRDEGHCHSEMIGGGPFNLQPGEWTDDTSMALALADSLIMCSGFDADDLMQRFLAWFDDGKYSCTDDCFDVGNITRVALNRFRHTGNAYAGAVAEDTAGNGSLMRVAPVALYALHDSEMAARIARDQSRTTHGAPQAVQACEFFTMLLREAILGSGRDTILQPHSWDGHAAIEAIASGCWRGKKRDDIKSSSYVVATLEAALWSVANTQGFEEAMVLAVNLGGDTDTVGAVTGQIAGAIYGASAIPERWLKPLAWRTKIEKLACGLLEHAQLPSDQEYGPEITSLPWSSDSGRTSADNPLRIAAVSLPAGAGRIGITFCPGKKDKNAMTGVHNRDLATDIQAILDWGAVAVVTLIEAHEFKLLHVTDLGDEVRARGIQWFFMPIKDGSVPDQAFETTWNRDAQTLHALLHADKSIVVHCRGGLGRAGMIAARLLVEQGLAPDAAISHVRAARRNAIETLEQEHYLRNLPCQSDSPVLKPESYYGKIKYTSNT